MVWIMDFVHGVLATVNIDLAMRVHTEGKAFLVRRGGWEGGGRERGGREGLKGGRREGREEGGREGGKEGGGGREGGGEVGEGVLHVFDLSLQEERKAQSIPTHQLPGVDLDFKILFTKVE